MIRRLNMILMLTSLAALIAVYALKYATVDAANANLAMKTKIEEQKTELSLLKADWAYINQPGYIAPIIERHAEDLQMAMIGPEQFISIDDIPMRKIEPDSDALTELLEALESGVDPIAVLIEANAE